MLVGGLVHLENFANPETFANSLPGPAASFPLYHLILLPLDFPLRVGNLLLLLDGGFPHRILGGLLGLGLVCSGQADQVIEVSLALRLDLTFPRGDAPIEDVVDVAAKHPDFHQRVQTVAEEPALLPYFGLLISRGVHAGFLGPMDIIDGQLRVECDGEGEGVHIWARALDGRVCIWCLHQFEQLAWWVLRGLGDGVCLWWLNRCGYRGRRLLTAILSRRGYLQLGIGSLEKVAVNLRHGGPTLTSLIDRFCDRFVGPCDFQI